jgi:EAL domain-containing protein (putative c-di-GMP-specific phosphodiesterase class I)
VNEKGRIVGGEALVRWQHPERGLLAPARFIDILEENESISTLTHWVIFKVAEQLKILLQHAPVYLSINLSARDFEEEHLPEIISNATKTGIPPSRLKFEITESACVRDMENSMRIMETLNRYNHELLIDDFGTGHSSLGYLYRIPATTLKIDKVFVDHIVHDREEFNYLKDIIKLIRNRRKAVLIEGVSNAEQFNLLNNGLCDRFQGFYFSEPVPADIFEKYIRQNVTLPLTERLD